MPDPISPVARTSDIDGCLEFPLSSGFGRGASDVLGKYKPHCIGNLLFNISYINPASHLYP